MTRDQRILDALPVHPVPDTVPDAAAHRLRLDGLVASALDLDGDALARFPQVALTEDFVCSEGWVARAQAWAGVRVADLLDAAGVRAGAAWAEFAAADFRYTVPLDEARTALVALTLGGVPLAVAHGGPARLVVPGAACFTSIKWLDRIQVLAQRREDTAPAIALARLK